MARSIWSGSLSFGLVNVPVGLYTATEPHRVSFHQFQEGTTSRIRNKRVNEKTGKEVDYDDIAKGAEVGDGRYVMLTQEELESVEPGRSRSIEITDFVDAAEIDPIYYQKSYYLAPSDESAGKAYKLLVRAMEEAARIGIATFVMRGKQYLAAIRPSGDVLVLETMFFADEVRDPAQEVDELPVKARLSSKDVRMAVALIESLTAKWDPTNYHDTYAERVEELIEAKRKDEVIVREEPAEEGGEVLDLVAALEASLDAAKGHQPGNRRQAEKLVRRAKDEADAPDDDADLSAMSKSDLYDLAQDLGIPGRSTMGRKELAEAIGKAGTRGSKKAG